MKQLIEENINDPKVLEKLYHENETDFRRSFEEVARGRDTDLIRFWNIRLAYEKIPVSVDNRDLLFVVILSLIAGLLIKLPEIFHGLEKEAFYARNLAIIVFNGPILFALWQNKIFNKKTLLMYGSVVLILVLYFNILPYDDKSDSLQLSLIHAPLFLWCVFGLAFVALSYRNVDKLSEFISFNVELLIMSGLILIAGGILTAITIALFSAINMQIEKFYSEYIVMTGAIATPIISYYLIRLYPDITRKIAPVIAKIFAPIVLLTMFFYLISLFFAKGRILEDRTELIIFNIMLLGVMAIIIFSISELDKWKVKNREILILFSLAILTIIVNAIALATIIGRISHGITPNRTVVLVSNMLIFVHLIRIAQNLYLSYFKKHSLISVEQRVVEYLPVYAVWTVIVIFLFPFLFRFA